MLKRLFFILFFIFPICLPEYSRAQNAQNGYEQQQVQREPFSKNKWEKLRKKVKIKESKPEPKKEEVKADKKKRGPEWELDPTVSQVLMWALFGALISLLLFLVLNTLGINPFRKDRKITRDLQIDIESLAEHLDEADLDPYLLEAIKTGQYKLVIRLYYLQIVQRLNYAGKIKWKRHKTNKNYVNEMRSYNDYDIFRDLTLSYEKCWFGPGILTKDDYEKISPQFINYVKNIRL